MTTCLGKSCSFGLPRVPFVNCCQFMYLVISLLVLRAGCGIWLYQFLIIAYLFTLSKLLISCLAAVKNHLNKYEFTPKQSMTKGIIFHFDIVQIPCTWRYLDARCYRAIQEMNNSRTATLERSEANITGGGMVGGGVNVFYSREISILGSNIVKKHKEKCSIRINAAF